MLKILQFWSQKFPFHFQHPINHHPLPFHSQTQPLHVNIHPQQELFRSHRPYLFEFNEPQSPKVVNRFDILHKFHLPASYGTNFQFLIPHRVSPDRLDIIKFNKCKFQTTFFSTEIVKRTCMNFFLSEVHFVHPCWYTFPFHPKWRRLIS